MPRPLSAVALPVLVIFSAAQAVLGACPVFLCLASDGGALDQYRVNGDLMYREGQENPNSNLVLHKPM
jgi:hypothetical protein